jgi:hypothetical protein
LLPIICFIPLQFLVAGVVSHSLDWRKSAGGFIHGYRYTGIHTSLILAWKALRFPSYLHLTLCLARALHRILEWKNHGVEWYHHEIPTVGVLNMIVKRINEASVCEFFTQLTPMNLVTTSKNALSINDFFHLLLFRLRTKCLVFWLMLLFTVSSLNIHSRK